METDGQAGPAEQSQGQVGKGFRKGGAHGDIELRGRQSVERQAVSREPTVPMATRFSGMP